MTIKEWDFDQAPSITKPCLTGRKPGDETPIKCVVNDGGVCFWEKICGRGSAFNPNFDRSKLPLKKVLSTINPY